MRPLICAEPMLRAPRPEMVCESTLTGPEDCGFAGCGVCAAAHATSATRKNDEESQRVRLVFISRSFLSGSVLFRFGFGGRLRSARRLLARLLRGRLLGFGLLRRRGRGVGRGRGLRLRGGRAEACVVNRDVGLDLL